MLWFFIDGISSGVDAWEAEAPVRGYKISFPNIM